MRKLVLLFPLFIALICVSGCASSSYNADDAAAFVTKIQNGDSLTGDDYVAMIELATAGLDKFDASLDTMNVHSTVAYDSAMKVLAGNQAFVKMINDCLLFERVLRDAPLDDKAKKLYSNFMKRQAEFKEKYTR